MNAGIRKPSIRLFIPLLLVLVIVASFIGMAVPALATASGPLNAGTGASVSIGSNTDWYNPGDIVTTGSPYARVVGTSDGYLVDGTSSDYLRGTNYGFAVPSDATINGITVQIRRDNDYTDANVRDLYVYLVKNGSIQAGTNQNRADTSTNWGGSFGTPTYGGASDTWNNSWNVADINNSNFGVALAVQVPSVSGTHYAFPRVDYMQITVTYTAPGVTVTPTSGLTTTEAAGTATFTIKLNTQPTADVTIGLTSNDNTEGTVLPASVTFTSSTWNTAQTVTVTGVNDDVDDGDIPYSIVTGAASSSDTTYGGMDASDVGVTNADMIHGVSQSLLSLGPLPKLADRPLSLLSLPLNRLRM